jgi:NAD+ diphosphatase
MPFGGNPLDRASARRGDPVWIAAQRKNALFLPVWQNKPFVTHETRAGFLPWRAAFDDGVCVFLGLDGAQPLFAIGLTAEAEPILDGGAFQEMRSAAFVLPARDTAIAGQAKALIDWHARHRFCPNCGAATDLADGGYRRVCGLAQRSISPAPIRW